MVQMIGVLVVAIGLPRMLAPAVTVIGYEQRDYRHQAQSLRSELD